MSIFFIFVPNVLREILLVKLEYTFLIYYLMKHTKEGLITMSWDCTEYRPPQDNDVSEKKPKKSISHKSSSTGYLVVFPLSISTSRNCDFDRLKWRHCTIQLS